MFDFVEKNKGLVKILLAVIALGLVIGVGLGGYSAFGEPYLAKVGNSRVTEHEFAEATGGQDVPQEQRAQVLSQLIQRQLLLNEANDLYFGVSDKVLNDIISTIPSFMENGKFSKQRYHTVLASQQKTEQQYKKALAREIQIQQLLQPLVESRLVSKTLLQKLATLLLERREINLAKFIPQAVMSQVSVSGEEVKKYYDQNKGVFQLPQQVRVEYIVLAQEALAQNIQVSEEEVDQFQADNKGSAQEERQARHILFALPKKANANTKAEVKAKAEAILQEVKADPTKFTDLARLHSQDTGSAQQGGELGFFKQGVMVPAFDQAVFTMKKGEISDLVETAFGFHIIQVEDIRQPNKENVREEALAAVKKQKAGQAFLAEQNKLAEALPMAKDLQSVAEKFHLGVQKSDWLSRAAAKEAIMNHENIREAIFSDEVLNKQYNTDLLEVSPGVMLAARVIDKKPAIQQTLEQVREVISAQLKEDKAMKLAKEIGRKTLADLKAGQPVNLVWSDPQNIDRLTPSDHADTVRNIFKVPMHALPGYVGVDTAYGYAIYRVSKIVPPSKEEKAEQKNIEMILLQFYGQSDASSYVQSLQKKTKIDVPRPAVSQS
jgi:peptidyl-prolyl cis-trans isomerase D